MITTTNPATGKKLKTYKVLDQKQIRARVQRADKAFESWKDLSYKKRAALFVRLAKELREHQDEYASIITAEMGKPITQSRAEIEKCAWNCEFYAQETERYLAEESIATEAKESYVRFDPLGVIFFVMPWNFPFWQVLRQAAPTMMAGNTVVLKHASNVPGCGKAIEKAFTRAGFPRGVFQNIVMSSRDAETVIEDFRIKGVSLTGSVGAGSAVAALAGKYVKRSVMELGGSDPFIVLDDANVTEAAKMAAASRLISCGQSCISAKRFIVTKKNLEKFTEEHIKAFSAMTYGDPVDSETAVGPVSSPEAAQELEEQIKKSVRKGAKIAYPKNLKGGIKADGAWLQPTILTHVKPGMPAYEEELFGPVSSIIVAKNDDDAIRIANDTIYGLSSSLWTKSKTKAKKYIPQINAGAVFINTLSKSDPRMPFGGINHGGFGRELGGYGIKEFTNIKSVWIEK